MNCVHATRLQPNQSVLIVEWWLLNMNIFDLNLLWWLERNLHETVLVNKCREINFWILYVIYLLMLCMYLFIYLFSVNMISEQPQSTKIN